MQSIDLQTVSVTSPVNSDANRVLLEYLRTMDSENRYMFELKDGVWAFATAVFNSDGRVLNLYDDMSGSIPVDDVHSTPVPRSQEAYMNNDKYYPRFLESVKGIAAYKIVTTHSVLTTFEQRIIGKLPAELIN